MSVIGVVAEYNPFHFGHEHHLTQTVRQLGTDCPVVCVMSGDFIQRGQVAVYSKFARAEAAIGCGVDLVLELPLPWTLSSAEGFARGAVGLLGATGVVTHLSFGSECGETEPLERLAELLLDPLFINDIKAELNNDEGISFAAARQRAAAKRVGELSCQLEAPNNILAVEYIKQLYDQNLHIKPITVQRFGSGHDQTSESGPRSASEIRRAIASGDDITGSVPVGAFAVYQRENKLGRGPVLDENLELAILSRLRMLDDAAFAALPDAGEGLNFRLARAAREESTVDAVIAATKTKRYALSRIRRMTMCAALGIRADDARGIPPYARVLAATQRGCAVLREMRTKSTVPVVTKPAGVRELDAKSRHIFDVCSAAHDLFSLGYTAREERRGGSDWRVSPKILNNQF